MRLGVSESYLIRDEALNLEDGRIETAVTSARYGKQSKNGEHEVVGQAFGRYRLFASEDDGDPSPWATGASASWRNYFYNDHLDPLGALEIAGDVGLAKDDIGASDLGLAVSGRVGWIWARSRASKFRIAGTMRYQSGEIFFGASLEATYGLLDVGYVGATAYPHVGMGTSVQ